LKKQCFAKTAHLVLATVNVIGVKNDEKRDKIKLILLKHTAAIVSVKMDRKQL
jgi:hypothetical protein